MINVTQDCTKATILHPLRNYETSATAFVIKAGESDPLLTEFTFANGRLKWDIEPEYASCPNGSDYLDWSTTEWYYIDEDDTNNFITRTGGRTKASQVFSIYTTMNANMVFNVP